MPDPIPSKLSRSWLLLRTSLTVIRQNKKLLLFPLVTSFFSAVMLLFFLAPALLYPTGHTLREMAHWATIGRQLGLDWSAKQPTLQPNAIFFGYLAVVYLVSMFLATFFNAAFYHEILKALAGDAVSVGTGLRFAWSRARSILMWSLLAGTVGLIIKGLEERFGWIGQWVLRLIGVVWSVASIFAIPVIIREGTTNPFDLLRQSAVTLRKAWGESLIGYVGVTVSSWIVLLGSLAFLAGAIALAVLLRSPLLLFTAVATWLAGMFLLSYLVSVAGHVYRCALYVYASEGVVPAPYTPELMDAAWKVKKT